MGKCLYFKWKMYDKKLYIGGCARNFFKNKMTRV